MALQCCLPKIMADPHCVCAHPAQAGLSWLPCSLKHEQRECTASDPFEVLVHP